MFDAKGKNGALGRPLTLLLQRPVFRTGHSKGDRPQSTTSQPMAFRESCAERSRPADDPLAAWLLCAEELRATFVFPFVTGFPAGALYPAAPLGRTAVFAFDPRWPLNDQ